MILEVTSQKPRAKARPLWGKGSSFTGYHTKAYADFPVPLGRISLQQLSGLTPPLISSVLKNGTNNRPGDQATTTLIHGVFLVSAAA